MRAAILAVGLILAIALLLTACDGKYDRGAWARNCVDEGNPPSACVDAAERLYSSRARP